ncbi:MAG: hypothetical protein GWP91_23910 [Rhodobacterales bacterium]|nr:hypothetical protein [Rhodobacterales bacterium]
MGSNWFPTSVLLVTAACGLMGRSDAPPRDTPKHKPADKQKSPSKNERPSWKAPEAPCTEKLQKGFFTYPFEWEGKQVKVRMYLPGGPPNRDIVVALHGGSGSAKSIVRRTELDERAQEDKFILLVPIASPWTEQHGTRWKSGKFTTKIDTTPFRDDVAFLDALTRAVKKDTCSKDILAVGFSNGGQMAYRWGCQSTLPSAILSVAGTLLVDPSSCKGPTPVRGYVGKDDRLFTEAPFPDTDQPTAIETLSLWAKINQCSTKAPIRTTQGDATCAEWQDCQASTILCVVDGFPHAWPVPSQKTNPDCNATQDGWTWFNEKSK